MRKLYIHGYILSDKPCFLNKYQFTVADKKVHYNYKIFDNQSSINLNICLVNKWLSEQLFDDTLSGCDPEIWTKVLYLHQRHSGKLTHKKFFHIYMTLTGINKFYWWQFFPTNNNPQICCYLWMCWAV